MERRLVFLSGTIGVALFVLTTVVGGALFPGYSHVEQLISESYAHGTTYGPWLRFLGYLPSGALFAVFAWAATRVFAARKYTLIGFAGIGIGYGLGTVLAAFFPCEAGCQMDGSASSISQMIHNLSGLLTYLVVPAALVVLGVRLRKRPGLERLGWSALACGFLATFGFILLIEISDTGYVGLAQRFTEGCILWWITACALHCKEPSATGSRSVADPTSTLP